MTPTDFASFRDVDVCALREEVSEESGSEEAFPERGDVNEVSELRGSQEMSQMPSQQPAQSYQQPSQSLQQPSQPSRLFQSLQPSQPLPSQVPLQPSQSQQQQSLESQQSSMESQTQQQSQQEQQPLIITPQTQAAERPATPQEPIDTCNASSRPQS